MYFEARMVLFVPSILYVGRKDATFKISNEREDFTMKKMMSKLAKKGLDLLEKNASKKANAECMGFLYEPKVPKKLKKTLCLMLASAVTTVALFGGSVTNCFAATHNEENWQTLVTNPTSTLKSSNMCLYITPESYRWAVTSHYSSSGYGKVTLSGVNTSISILYGQGAVLTEEGYRDFKIDYRSMSGADFARLKVMMDYDSYPTQFFGYGKLL